MALKSQRYRTDDGLITLVVERTLTISSECPEGYEDWIIALEPGLWHTHPELIDYDFIDDNDESVDFYIQEILSDKLSIKMYYKHDELVDVSVLDLRNTTLDEQLVVEQEKIESSERIVLRSWSGNLIAEVKPADS
ncbi:MAG: hypothetical protein JJ974_05420 [Phycisphaerales bacterium]|nr:hypothetical protein [Phycisphaerales bacterium]